MKFFHEHLAAIWRDEFAQVTKTAQNTDFRNLIETIATIVLK